MVNVYLNFVTAVRVLWCWTVNRLIWLRLLLSTDSSDWLKEVFEVSVEWVVTLEWLDQRLRTMSVYCVCLWCAVPVIVVSTSLRLFLMWFVPLVLENYALVIFDFLWSCFVCGLAMLSVMVFLWLRTDILQTVRQMWRLCGCCGVEPSTDWWSGGECDYCVTQCWSRPCIACAAACLFTCNGRWWSGDEF